MVKEKKIETMEALVKETGYSKNRIWSAFSGHMKEYKQMLATMEQNHERRKKKLILKKVMLAYEKLQAKKSV